MDPGAKDNWRTAPVLNPSNYHFIVDSHREPQWFRIPVARETTLTVTLTHPQKDYDLFIFSALEEATNSLDDIGEASGEAQELPANAKEIGLATCSSRYIRQVANLGRANTDRLLPPSCRDGNEPEQMIVEVQDDSGWYYLMVAGHNGANDPDTPYTLQITRSEGTSGGNNFDVPLFDPLESTQFGQKTIILTNYKRFSDHYGEEVTEELKNKLEELATHPAVAGEVIDLDTEPGRQIREIYDLWDDHATDPLYANYVAASSAAHQLARGLS